MRIERENKTHFKLRSTMPRSVWELLPLHKQLGIKVMVHQQAVTDYRGGWNYQEHGFDNNHLFREAISLAAVW